MSDSKIIRDNLFPMDKNISYHWKARAPILFQTNKLFLSANMKQYGYFLPELVQISAVLYRPVLSATGDISQ